MLHRSLNGKDAAFEPMPADHCTGKGQGDGVLGIDADPMTVRGALEAVLASRGFVRSPRMRKFLRFIVEETLAGRGAALKEYVIAVEVFERDDSYDPQTNSLVRVEASRLRAKLEKYHSDAKPDLIIELPSGAYVPAFKLSETDASAGPEITERGAEKLTGQRNVRWAAVVAAVAVLIAVAAMHVPTRFFSVWHGAGPTEDGVSIPSIAVLPLREISDGSSDGYLGDGLTDALITSLAGKQSVRVIAYASSRAFRDTSLTIQEIAHELEVSHVVEGTVLRQDGQVRLSAKLIDAATGQYLWADRYDTPIVEVLALQDDLAGRIVTALSTVASKEKESAHVAVDSAAQEAYLMGRYFRNMVTESGFHKGISYFKEAIAKDPEFAEAYSGMAACYCILGGHGFELVDPREGMPLAREAVMEALRLNDELAEAHAFLGIIRLKFDWDWDGAERSFKRSIEINPSFAQARLFYSYFLEAMGDQEGAVREAEEARRLDPLSLSLNINLVWQYLRAGRQEDARDRLRRTAEIDPGFWGLHWAYGHLYRQSGDLDRAIEYFEKAVATGEGHAMPVADLGYSYAMAGRREEARAMLSRLQALAEKNFVSPYNRAVIHIGLGDQDAAFADLSAAYDARSRSLAWLRVAEEFSAIEDDPRYLDLIARVGLPH